MEDTVGINTSMHACDESDLDAESDRLTRRRIGRMNQRGEISTLSAVGESSC